MKPIVKNLTPHDINIVRNGITERVIKADGVIARAKQFISPQGELDGIPLIKMEFGEPENLPDPEVNIFLIVSLPTAQAAIKAGRSTDDLLLTSLPVRDEKGQIIGCESLSVV